MNEILTILGILVAIVAGVLLGSKRQKAKDEKVLEEYKTETEAVIRTINQKAAEARVETKKADTEKKIMQETVKIVVKDPPVVKQHEVEPEKVAESVVTEEDSMEALKAMQEDSASRAEELGRRYEK